MQLHSLSFKRQIKPARLVNVIMEDQFAECGAGSQTPEDLDSFSLHAVNSLRPQSVLPLCFVLKVSCYVVQVGFQIKILLPQIQTHANIPITNYEKSRRALFLFQCLLMIRAHFSGQLANLNPAMPPSCCPETISDLSTPPPQHTDNISP